MHVLLVEDDHRLARVLRRLLEDDRHVVEVAHDGESGLEIATSPAGIEVIILDIGLPDMTGLEVARRVRRAGSEVAILMLTARDTVNDRVIGLDAGADDYLVKPFAFEELLARLRALLRRETAREDEAIEVGDLRLDPVTYTVSRAGRPIELTALEFRLLEFLMRHAGRVLTRDQIVAHVWGYDAEHSSKPVDVYIHYLRRKVDAGEQRPLLHTVRSVGYALRP